ncbi:MAG: RNA-binding cell elongation regulator Jag/EloR [Longimicrobiales bacterium]
MAVSTALDELGLSKDEAEVEVIQEPERGFMGFGGSEAIVRVKKAPAEQKRRRRRRGRGGSNEGGGGRGNGGGRGGGRGDGGGRGGGRSGGGGRGDGGGRGGGKEDKASDGQQRQQNRPKKQQGQQSGGRKDKADGSRRQGGNGKRRGESVERTRSEPSAESQQEADVNEQAGILKEFMEGLLDAFGLEGDTTTRIDDDVIYVDVAGEQTEALIGTRGAILQSILDLMKIVVQRKTHHRARIRLDIAGYTERRREALGIYTKRLSEQVLADGQEVMLEPMHPGDRKVVHDSAAEIEGVRSWSEGEEPNRSVVIGLAPGFSPSEDSDDE